MTTKTDAPLGEVQTEDYFVRFSQSDISLLELECVGESLSRLNFTIVAADDSGAIINCSKEVSTRLIRLLGGSYKIAKIAGKGLSDSLKNVPLPYTRKFEWTISSYKCSDDFIQNVREEMRYLLKINDLGKSKHVAPNIGTAKRGEDEEGLGRGIHELKAAELARRIFSEDEGLDLVAHGGIEGYGPFFGYTVDISDVDGFEKRDFERPYQDPRMTLGTRIARMVCNLAIPADRVIVCDPFCGLGTILQEALVAGHSVIGIDKKSENVFRAKSNLKWITEEYSIPHSRIIRILRYDAQRIDQLPIPKVDCVASEPILLPTYKSNPSETEAKAAMQGARDVYARSLESMAHLLAGSNSRVAMISPTLVDSRGRQNTLLLGECAERAGLRPYWPRSARKRPAYPIRVETSKRKTVQRNISLFAPY